MRWNGQGGLVCPLRGQSLESRLAAQRSVGRADRTPSMRTIGILVVFALVTVAPAPSASACTVPNGRVATDRDLTHGAHAIVRVRAEAYVEPPCPPDVKCADRLGKIRFRVLEVLKGPYPSTLFHAWGRLGDQQPHSEPDSCLTTAYKAETEFLIFLQNWSGTWVVSPTPLAATNREVQGENDPRVVAVRAEVKRMKQQTRAPKVPQ